MSRYWAIWLVAIGLLLSLSAGAVAQGRSTPSNEFRFIGFTDETFNGEPDTITGDQGMIAMHALCQDDFGPFSRTSTSEEFWLSPNAYVPTANSWLHSVGAHRGDISWTDFSGLETSTAPHCNGWTNLDGEGMVVTPDGKPSANDAKCNVFRPEPCRDCRRLLCLSHATIASSLIWA